MILLKLFANILILVFGICHIIIGKRDILPIILGIIFGLICGLTLAICCLAIGGL